MINMRASFWRENMLACLSFFVPYLFLEVHSFPEASFENCPLLGPGHDRGQIIDSIFAPNGGYCLYIQRVLV